MQNIFEIIEEQIKLNPERNVVILGHIQPDGDCMGSSWGMKYLLRDNYNIDATVINQPIARFDFLGDSTRPGCYDFSNAFAIQVDNATVVRSADPEFINAPFKLKIDHHIVVEQYGDKNVEELLSSCCEIIATHAIKHGLKFSTDSARALYTGMVTDTGRFSFSSVTADTLATASTLLRSGFDLGDTMSRISRRRMNNVQFISKAYSLLKISEKGIPNIYITQDIIDEFSLTPDMVSEALSCMRDIEGYPIFVLFADLGDKIRVEFRSDRIKINQVAAAFGGGGHACACGARLKTKEEIPLVIAELEKCLP